MKEGIDISNDYLDGIIGVQLNQANIYEPQVKLEGEYDIDSRLQSAKKMHSGKRIGVSPYGEEDTYAADDYMREARKGIQEEMSLLRKKENKRFHIQDLYKKKSN